MRRERNRAMEAVTFDEPHEVLLVEEDGRENYQAELAPGRSASAANWVAYTQVVEASKIIGGTVTIRKLADKEKLQPCDACNGRGCHPTRRELLCQVCGGSGKLPESWLQPLDSTQGGE